jgi:hypothetical protein
MMQVNKTLRNLASLKYLPGDVIHAAPIDLIFKGSFYFFISLCPSLSCNFPSVTSTTFLLHPQSCVDQPPVISSFPFSFFVPSLLLSLFVCQKSSCYFSSYKSAKISSVWSNIYTQANSFEISWFRSVDIEGSAVLGFYALCRENIGTFRKRYDFFFFETLGYGKWMLHNVTSQKTGRILNRLLMRFFSLVHHCLFCWCLKAETAHSHRKCLTPLTPELNPSAQRCLTRFFCFLNRAFR